MGGLRDVCGHVFEMFRASETQRDVMADLGRRDPSGQLRSWQVFRKPTHIVNITFVRASPNGI